MFLRFKKNMKNNGICQGRLRLFHHMYGLYGTCFAKFVCFRSVHQLWIMRTLLSTAVERKICAGKSWSNATNQHPRNPKPPIEVAVGQAQQEIPPRIPIAVRSSIVESECCRFFLSCLIPCGFMRVPKGNVFYSCLLLLLFSINSQENKVAQCGAVPNGTKPNVLPFLLLVAYSANILNTMVALCGVSQNLENKCFSMFAVFAVFSKFWKNQAWRYVALSQNLKNNVFLHFCCLLFSANLQK